MYAQSCLVESLSNALQALRLANRAMSNISRIALAAREAGSEETTTAASIVAKMPDHSFSRKASNSGLVIEASHIGCEIAMVLFKVLPWIAQLYIIQGSPKQADFFMRSALELAEDLNAPRMKARILACQVQLQIALGKDAAWQQKLAALQSVASEVRTARHHLVSRS